jgi:hypothetical protein
MKCSTDIHVWFFLTQMTYPIGGSLSYFLLFHMHTKLVKNWFHDEMFDGLSTFFLNSSDWKSVLILLDLLLFLRRWDVQSPSNNTVSSFMKNKLYYDLFRLFGPIGQFREHEFASYNYFGSHLVKIAKIMCWM